MDWSWHVSADAVGALQRTAGMTDVAVQRDRLAAWSGGDVAVLTLAADGAVTDCVSPHPRLGLDGTLVGRPLDEVVPAFERADGRRTWILGDEVVDDVRVRTVVLSDQQPERGVAGSVVRMVLGASGEVWVLLVAEDRMYDRAPGTVAVGPPSRRGSP